MNFLNHNFDKLLMSAIFSALAFIYLHTHDANIQQLLGYAFTSIATLTGARALVSAGSPQQLPPIEPKDKPNGPGVS